MTDCNAHSPSPPSPNAPAGAHRRRWLFWSICGLGVSSILTQLVLTRELLSVFGGNEMVLGIVLGNWLGLMGVGTLLGRRAAGLRRPMAALLVVQVMTAVLPITAVFALRALRNVVFTRGLAVGVTEIVAGTFVLLLPYCVVGGFSLTLACTILAGRSGPEGIGRVYFLDSIGEIIGGVMFSFVLVGLLNHFRILAIPAALNLVLAVGVTVMMRRKVLTAVLAVVATVALALASVCDLDGASGRMLYAGQHVAYRGDSAYGSIVVTESAGQHNFFANGELLFSTHNIEQVEQTVHYAMAQRPRADRVLLISGGVSGTAREIIEYPSARVDYVELDPLLLKTARRFVPDALADERIRTIATDGRLFVRQADAHYDVIIADVPDPLTCGLNRFYTRQFYRQARRAMTDRGVLCVTLKREGDYVGAELADMIAICHRTLRDVFSNVKALPTSGVTFLASNAELIDDAEQIADRMEAAGVKAELLTRYYLREFMLTEDRMRQVRQPPGRETMESENSGDRAGRGVNDDFAPVLYYSRLLFWLREFDFAFGALEAGLLLVLAVYLLRIRPVPFAIFSTGFAASSLQVVLLLGFQILYGSVYHKLGVIVTMFMLGLAVGSFVANRMLARWHRRGLVKIELALAVYAAAVPAALMALGRIADPTLSAAMSQTAVPILTLGLATLVGMEFPLAGKADFAGVAPTASRLYLADLLGAAVGALLVSTLLIPLIGVVGVCVAVGVLKLLGAGVVFRAAGR